MFGALVCLACTVGFVVLVVTASGGSRYDRLVQSGRPAKGIILHVNPTGTRVSRSPNIDQRAMHLDVEVPGEKPFEVRANVFFAANLTNDVLPGASVELRVHKSNSSWIAIVGPSVGLPGTRTP